MSRVEQFESIRRDAREGMGIWALARKHRVHRRVVRQALASAVPPGRKQPVREAPVLGEWKPLIRAWVEADQELPKSSGIPRGGSGSGWSLSVARGSASRRLASTSRRCVGS